jgi:hypothetical protein
VLQQDPFSGHVFCFRGRRGDLLKALYWDTQGYLFAKRLEKGRFVLMAFVNSCERALPSACRWRSPDDVRCLQRPGRRVYVDGRSGSYAGIGYPMMTDASEGYLGLAADVSASARPK